MANVKFKLDMEDDFINQVGGKNKLIYVKDACEAVLKYNNSLESIKGMFDNFSPEIKSTHLFSKKPKEISYKIFGSEAQLELRKDSSVKMFATNSKDFIEKFAPSYFDFIYFEGNKIGNAVMGYFKGAVAEENISISYNANYEEGICYLYKMTKTDGYYSAVSKFLK